MYIYNVSIQLESAIESDWLSWMNNKHLAEVMASGCFTAYNIFQLIEPTEDGVCTYIVQYQADSLEDYERYAQTFAPKLRQDGFDRFGDRFIAFRTILKKIK